MGMGPGVNEDGQFVSICHCEWLIGVDDEKAYMQACRLLIGERELYLRYVHMKRDR